jgi:hypothetical protein
VRRFVLSVMDLVVDQLITPIPNQKLVVKYKEKQLCDQFFQENIVTISSNESIVLSR